MYVCTSLSLYIYTYTYINVIVTVYKYIAARRVVMFDGFVTAAFACCYVLSLLRCLFLLRY